MKKIAVICAAGLDNFIDPIIEGLADEYNVRKFIVRNKWDIHNAIHWGDTIFFEWCNEVAVTGTNYKGIQGKKVIIRLHSYEIFTDYPKQINWDTVNKLIFVAPHIREILDEMSPGIVEKVKSEIIYNGIDVDKIPFKEREPGHNIAWVGYINYKKNPQMALQILKKLVTGVYDVNDGDFTADPQYKLHIAGSYQDLRYKVYLEHMIKEMGLEDNVIFHGWIDDMEDFWKDKNYLLHTSIHEGHSLAITEAMARGIKPVIHSFRGAKELYSNQDSSIGVLFATVEQAANRIMTKDYESKWYRSWVIDKGWTLQNQLGKINNVIKEII